MHIRFRPPIPFRFSHPVAAGQIFNEMEGARSSRILWLVVNNFGLAALGGVAVVWLLEGILARLAAPLGAPSTPELDAIGMATLILNVAGLGILEFFGNRAAKALHGVGPTQVWGAGYQTPAWQRLRMQWYVVLASGYTVWRGALGVPFWIYFGLPIFTAIIYEDPKHPGLWPKLLLFESVACAWLSLVASAVFARQPIPWITAVLVTEILVLLAEGLRILWQDTRTGQRRRARALGERQAMAHAALDSVGGVKKAAQETLKNALRIARATGGALYILQAREGRDVLEPRAWYPSEERDKPARTPPEGASLISQVWRTGQPQCIDDLTQCPDLAPPPGGPEAISALAAPLVGQGRILGVVCLTHWAPGHFGESPAEGIEALCQVAAVTIERALLLDELRELRPDSLSSSQLLGHILELFVRLLHCRFGSAFQIEGTRARIVAVSGRHPDPAAARDTGIDLFTDPLLAEIVKERQTKRLHDARTDPRWHGYAGTRDVRGWLAVPLRLGRQVVALLTLDSDQEGFFDEVDESTAELFAAFAERLLQSMFAEAQRRRERGILALVQQLLAPRDLEAVGQDIVRRLNRLFGVEGSALFLTDETTGDIECRWLAREEQVRRGPDRRGKPGQGLVGEAIARAQSVCVTDPRQDPRWDAQLDDVTGLTLQNLLVAPLVAGGRVLGALAIMNKLAGALDTEDAEDLQNLARAVAEAAQRVRTDSHLRELRALLREVVPAPGPDDLRPALRALLETVCRQASARGAALYALEPGGRCARVMLTVGLSGALEGLRLGLHETDLEPAVRARQPLYVPGSDIPVPYDEWAHRLVHFDAHPVTAAMILPLAGEQDYPVGALGVYDCAPGRQFGPADAAALTESLATAGVLLQRVPVSQLTTLVQNLLPVLPLGAVIVNHHGFITSANARAAQLLGYASAEALVGTRVQQLYWRKQATAREVQSALRQAGEVSLPLCELRTRSGGRLITPMSAIALWHGSVGFFMDAGTTESVAQRASLLAQLVEALGPLHPGADAKPVDFRALLTRFLSQAAQQMHTEAAALWLYDPDSQEFLAPPVSVGLHEPGALDGYLQPSVVLEAVLRRAEPVLIPDTAEDDLTCGRPFILREGVRSLAATRLEADGRVLGEIHFGSHELRFFTSEDAGLLRELAFSLALVVQYVRQQVQLRSLLRTAEAIAAGDSPTAVLRAALEALCQTTGLRHGAVYFTPPADGTREERIPEWVASYPPVETGAGEDAGSWAREWQVNARCLVAVARRQVVISGEVHQDVRYQERGCRLERCRSLIAAPLVDAASGQSYGVMALGDEEPGRTLFATTAFLAQLARHLVTRLAHFEDLAAQRRQFTEMAIFADLFRQPAMATSVVRVLEEAAHAIGQHLDVAVGLGLLEEHYLTFPTSAVYGFDYLAIPIEAREPQPVTVGLTGAAVRTKQTQYAPATARHPDCVFVPPNMQSELAIPLMAGGQVLGVLDAYRREEDGFTASQIALLESVAGKVALALSYARLAQAHGRNVERRAILAMAAVTRELGAGLGQLAALVDEQRGEPAGTGSLEEQRHALRQALGPLTELTRQFARYGPGETLALVDPVAVLQEAVGKIRAEAGPVPLETEVAPDSGRVRADEEAFRQVVVNLLRNALLVIPTGTGRIQVRLRRNAARGMIEVRVSDNGPGVAPDLQDELFEPRSPLQGVSPHAMRLPLSRLHCRAWGGDLILERTSPGEGATFRIDLPVYAPDGDLLGATGECMPARGWRAPRDFPVSVLLLDRETEWRQWAQSVLVGPPHYFHVVEATTIADAQTALRGHGVDLALLGAPGASLDGQASEAWREMLDRLHTSNPHAWILLVGAAWQQVPWTRDYPYARLLPGDRDPEALRQAVEQALCRVFPRFARY